MDVRIQVIGFVRNEWSEAQPFEANKIMQSISTIEVKEAFADGLFKIENQSELHILWHFHQSQGYELQTNTRSGDFRGVFACCSPRRPSAIGLTRVKLLRRDGNRLFVTGLDALNGTPVLDIKPYVEPSEIVKQADRQ